MCGRKLIWKKLPSATNFVSTVLFCFHRPGPCSRGPQFKYDKHRQPKNEAARNLNHNTKSISSNVLLDFSRYVFSSHPVSVRAVTNVNITGTANARMKLTVQPLLEKYCAKTIYGRQHFFHYFVFFCPRPHAPRRTECANSTNSKV